MTAARPARTREVIRALLTLAVVLGELVVTVALVRAAFLYPAAGFFLWLALVVGAVAGIHVGRHSVKMLEPVDRPVPVIVIRGEWSHADLVARGRLSRQAYPLTGRGNVPPLR